MMGTLLEAGLLATIGLVSPLVKKAQAMLLPRI